MDYLLRIDDYQDEMVKMLQELIAIKSVAGSPEEDAPFGAEVQKALDYMLEKAKAEEFEVEDIDHYGGHIDFGGYVLDEEGEIVGIGSEVMGILGHLDVVPEGTDWDREPFGGELVDGKVYGRGAIDDKGPVVAAFYAMKALKDAGIMPEKKVRLILGLDEETGWKGMEHYLKKVKAPDFGFTPDGEFPVIHGEMGILVFELAKKMAKTQGKTKGIVLRKVTGGNAPNMVADGARALLRADSYEKIRAKLETFQQETGYQIKAKGIGKSLEITVQGISAHGARPESGLNAISILMKFLGELEIENDDMQEFVTFYNAHIGFDLTGELMGCGLSDEPSGNLIFNVGMIDLDEEVARLTVNVRYPVTLTDEQVYEAMLPIVHEHDLGMIKLKHQPPIYLSEDDPMVCSLMEVYQKHTGDTTSKPLVIGGGTYARAVKNTVAFGAVFPGEPELAHQKNEHITVESLVQCAKIFADAIYQLADGRQVPDKGLKEAMVE